MDMLSSSISRNMMMDKSDSNKDDDVHEAILMSLSHRLEYIIRNDGSVVTMSVLLPNLPRDVFFTMFPTWTLSWFVGHARVCPVYLAFGFMKWCKENNVPDTFNLPLAAEALSCPTLDVLVPNAKRAAKFFDENHESFESSIVTNV